MLFDKQGCCCYSMSHQTLLLLAVSAFGPSPTPDEALTISNNAVKASFSAANGELLSLFNLQSVGGPDNYLVSPPPAPGPPPPSHPPFCVQQSVGSGTWYMKTGGDPDVKTQWKGPPLDRCCRAKDQSGQHCRWYPTQAACEGDLANWRQICLSCAKASFPIGCPTWGDDTPPQRGAHGLFLAWVDASPPAIALDAGWAGDAPDPSNGVPPGGLAIAPADCNLTSYTKTVDNRSLSMVLTHAPTTLRFHIVAALGAGFDNALNLSLSVELPLPNRSDAAAAAAAAAPIGPVRPQTVMVAFPHIAGIAISSKGGNGSSNAGINHFETGLGTDGLSLRAWAPSGGLHVAFWVDFRRFCACLGALKASHSLRSAPTLSFLFITS